MLFFGPETLMQRFLIILAIGIVFAAGMPPSAATSAEMRLALVIGNASYKLRPLPTPVNDATLVAQSLEAKGFKVTSLTNLNMDGLRKAFSDFSDSIRNAGPDAVAAVYFAGYALQLEGENYLLPVDAEMVVSKDMPFRAIGLSEEMHALAALHLKAAFLILDAARANPLRLRGQTPAGGLAWVEPEANMLIAFNAAPGTVASETSDGYGAYAKALAELIRGPGEAASALFDHVRLRVNQVTNGAQVPWYVSTIPSRFVLFGGDPGVPPRVGSPDQMANLRAQPLKKLGATDAYFVTLMRDTFDGYADFLADYWQDPMASRVQALLAARREAITWWRTHQAHVPDAYWTYLERYPRGPHAEEAHILLSRLGVSSAPPSTFARREYDIPPPLPAELPYIERPVLMLGDPDLAFEHLPPMPAHFLGPPPPVGPELTKPAASLGGPAPSVLVAPQTNVSVLPSWAAIPTNAPSPSSFGEGLVVRGTIDGPVKQNDHVATPSILPREETGDRKETAKPQAEPTASLREVPKASPGSPEPPPTPEQGTERASSSVGDEFRVLNERPLYAPVMTPETGRLQRTGKPQRTPSAVPIPISRPATIQPTNVNAPARRSATGPLPAQASSDELTPRTTASTPPQRKPAVSVRPLFKGESKPAAQAGVTPPRKQPEKRGESARTLPKPSTQPNVVRATTDTPNVSSPKAQDKPRVPSKPCTVTEGQQSCN